MKTSRSQTTYILLVLLLAVISSIKIFLPEETLESVHELSASKLIIALAAFFIIGIFYGGVG